MDRACQQSIAGVTADADPLTQIIVMEIAEIEGVTPFDLEPLALTIDPDALERLVDSMPESTEGPPPKVEFTYSGYVVTVRGDGTVSLAKPDPTLD